VLVAAASGLAQPRGKTLLVAAPAIPETLDPIFTGSRMSRYVRDTLYDVVPTFGVAKDERGNLVSDLEKGPICNLCESFQMSPDKKKWVIKFRPGVRSPAGNELTAEDARWSFDRMLKAGSPSHRGYFGVFSVDTTNPVTVVDKYTWEMNLTGPEVSLMATWAAPHPFGKIYDSAEIKKHAKADDPWGNEWLKTNIAGFGPWVVDKYTPGKELELRRNPNYHQRGLPAVDRVIFREVPSEATRAALLRSGSVDLALELPPRLVESLRATRGIKTVDLGGNEWMVWLLNQKAPPFDDVRVRRAVAHAAPVREILKTVYLDKPWVKRWDGYAPPNYMGSPVTWPYDENLEKARALLKEAGKEKIGFELIYEKEVAGSEEIAIIVKSQLAKIGVDVDLKGLAPAQYSEQYRSRKAQSVLFKDASWGHDGRYWLATFFHTRGPVNHGNHTNPEFDKLVDEITPVADPKQRTALSKRAHEIVVQDAPWAFAIGTGFSLPMRDNLSGFVWRVNNWVDVRTLEKN
jgi:peptide/nickel transport system substrate-binding protein